MSDTRRLDGQVAIVTGGAQGLGRRIALVLAEAGAKIVIGDIQDASDTVRDIRSGDGQALSLVADTAKPEDDDKLVNYALTEYGRLDCMPSPPFSCNLRDLSIKVEI
jgi:NAD(P)-dependent dehydrogenase (short-subunit alcohol dehydrogenase family)